MITNNNKPVALRCFVAVIYQSNETVTHNASSSCPVSTDSTISRDTRDSVDGALSQTNEDPKKHSRSRLLPGVSPSMRSINKMQESITEKELEQNLGTCQECGVSIEQFDEETLNLSIVVLSTFVHKSPSMAMPLVLRMLESVGRSVFVITLDCLIIVAWLFFLFFFFILFTVKAAVP